jgi:hypothetical protein
MLPAFKYLDIPNFDQISKILLDLVTTSLYKTFVNGNTVFRFTKTHDTVEFDIRDNKEFWNFLDCQEVLGLVPELSQALKNLGVTPLKMALILVTDEGTPLHSDFAPEGTIERINWPIVNGNTSQTWFIEVLPHTNTKIADPYSMESNKGYCVYDPKDAVKRLGSYILTQPIAFNFTVPHYVHTIDNEKTHPDLPRLLLTIDIDRSLIK